MNKRENRLESIIWGLVGVVIFISAWQLLALIKNDPTIKSVNDIFGAFGGIVTNRKFADNLFSTLKIITIGMMISSFIGITLAVIMDMHPVLRKMVSPLIEMFRNIPSITLFPILLAVYGIGDISRIFVIFWTSCPPILLTTMYGLKNIDEMYIEAGQMCGATKWQIMRYIKFPISLPQTLNGIKIGLGSGFVAIVVAEMLGATKGIGYMVLWTTNAFKYSETYAYIIIIGLMGMLMNNLMEILIKKVRRRLGEKVS